MSVRMMMWGLGPVQPLTLHLNNVSANGSGPAACGNPGNTGAPGLTIENGSGSYTILWELVSAAADHGPYIVHDANSQDPFWSGGSVCDGDSNTEQWRVTVNDLIFLRSVQATINVGRNWINNS